MNIFLFIALCVVVVGCCYWCGYSHGKYDGYWKGRSAADADNDAWWLRIESKVGEERVKIWREE